MQQSLIPYLGLLAISLGLICGPACKSAQSQRFVINQASIENHTEGTLHNVRVRHAPNGTVGTTNAILPHQSLNVGFDGRSMMADSCTISWTDDHNQYYQKEIILPKNVNKHTALMHLHYRINPSGKVTVAISEPHK